MNPDQTLARSLWEANERYHQLCYVAPEVRTAGTDAGLKGFWMNYFATRAAPMGPVGPEVVEAVFFYYGPSRVRRAIPDAWGFSTPERVLAARFEAMDQALRRELGPAIDSPAIAAAVEIHQRALEHANPLGKPLFAGWSGLEVPGPPHVALWHLTTLQREYRSGCHLIALGAAGLDGCESVVSHVAVDQAPQAWINDEAGWSDEDAAAAVERLQRKGWLDGNAKITEAGIAGRAEIERLTDELDGHRWVAIGEDQAETLRQAMIELTATFPADDQLDWREVYGDNPA